MTAALLVPSRIGDLSLPNRCVMAPMTRTRASATHVADRLAALYYAQRASAGLMISEGVPVSPAAVGCAFTPGLFSREQEAAWASVTSTVKAVGGRLFAQLWHVGRMSHPDLLPDGARPVGPSRRPGEGEVYTATGPRPSADPEPLSRKGVVETIAEFKAASKRARAAGFDGVEIQAGNGYLIEQFLSDEANDRRDRYGGDVRNRCRFLIETIEAVTEVWPAERIGVRLSPLWGLLGARISDAEELIGWLYPVLSKFRLGYLHVVEMSADDAPPDRLTAVRAQRTRYRGVYLANGGFDSTRAAADLESGHADLIAFGMPFIANPDLVLRMALDQALAEPDYAALYRKPGRSSWEGYTDYPIMERLEPTPHGGDASGSPPAPSR